MSDEEKIKLFKPIRSAIVRKDFQILFNDISIDSFSFLIKNKAIKDLKIQSSLPLSYSKDNQPQSSNSVTLSYVFNPVFRSNDVDSINSDIEKEISLTRIQLESAEYAQKIYEAKKSRIFNELTAAKQNLLSADLATKEKAVKDYPQLEKTFSSLLEPSESIQPFLIRLAYLNQKLHIRKTQKISGFISYITFYRLQ